MSWPQIVTYISYIFVVAAYTYKVMKIARMPIHLRWELYPIPHEHKRPYGGSYFEELNWWLHSQGKSILRDIVNMLKKYIFLNGYYQKNRPYWVSLYSWHTGFYLIVLSHVLSCVSAVAIVTGGIAVQPGSSSTLGVALYYVTIVVAVVSYVVGSLGSISLLLQRLTSRPLRTYASPANFFNYVFFLVVFVSGFIAWRSDPTFAVYREFWQSLITLKYMTVEPVLFIHIMLFSLFLIYLPFTRSTHYITILFSFFGVLWGDKPNHEDGEMREKIAKLLDKRVSWSAPHIQAGKKWSELASEEK